MKKKQYDWIRYLDEKEKGQFLKEILNICGKTKEIIDDWQATAEVENNPEISRALKK